MNLNLYERIRDRREKISIIGLGYVGLPLAVTFARFVNVIGFDISEEKIQKYLDGIDVTNEVGNQAVKLSEAHFTSNEKEIKDCLFHIVAVPTPINQDKTPDLSPIISATKTVGRNMKKGSLVVFESTVFPGVTEDICIPLLESESGLIFNEDFKVGYSPERINPSDKIHTLENIVKIVSGSDIEALENIAKVYEIIIKAGVYKAESIRVAEAAKVIENSQRDINIAFMNELSMVFNEMEIDTQAVLEAAGTKWNFLNFTPGLVGGHCIGVDPYYFIYKAEELGYHSQIILSGRKINDGMGKFIANNLIKNMIKANKNVRGAKVGILGIAFKENCPDVRNTKVIDIINELEEYGVETEVIDPLVNPEEVYGEYGIRLKKYEEVNDLDALLIAVPHDCFKELSLEDIKKLYRMETSQLLNRENTYHATSKAPSTQNFILTDVKGLYNKSEAEEQGFIYWRL